MENINCDVTIQDAKVLLDMGFITSDEFASFTSAKALMVKNAAKQYNHYLNESAFIEKSEENSLPSHVIS